MEVRIGGRAYSLACAPGEEDRLTSLARHVDSKLSDLARRAGSQPESTLLVLTCLTLADELFDMRQKGVASVTGRQAAQEQEVLAEAVLRMGQRLGSLADRLEER